jgi:hypothetical protein
MSSAVAKSKAHLKNNTTIYRSWTTYVAPGQLSLMAILPGDRSVVNVEVTFF